MQLVSQTSITDHTPISRAIYSDPRIRSQVLSNVEPGMFTATESMLPRDRYNFLDEEPLKAALSPQPSPAQRSQSRQIRRFSSNQITAHAIYTASNSYNASSPRPRRRAPVAQPGRCSSSHERCLGTSDKEAKVAGSKAD